MPQTHGTHPARIMIHCPIMGSPVFTGMVMDTAGFLAADLGRPKVRCSCCGLVHAWSKRDAFLEAAPAAAASLPGLQPPYPYPPPAATGGLSS